MKKIFFIFFTLTSFSSIAQVGTGSPYSFVGFGETNFRGNHLNRAMGGLDVYIDSIHPNINNPASYGTLKLTTYSVGVNYRNNKLANNLETQKVTSAAIDYIGVSIPTKRFGFGFGILPFSSVGYLLEDQTQINQMETVNRFTGEGGINNAFLSIGFKVFEGLNIGFTTNYGFGDITYRKTQVIDGIENGIYLESNSSLSGINYKASINLTIPVKELELHGLISFSPEAEFISQNIQIIYTRSLLNADQLGDLEETNLALTGLDKTKYRLPKSSSFGIGIGKNKKWFFGAQYNKINNSRFINEFVNQSNISYKDASRVGVGGFYIPEFSSITSYWKKVVYRFGYRSEDKGYLVNNQLIKENGITFGLGLPMASYSNTNVTFEFGKLGTKNNNLIEENYWAIRLGFSLNDIWFIKRKYN
ncbi:MAG: hypothetical protein P8L83_00270 [Flavobacteriaceae bacterium]|nr:hypothetical protein [Flavobacteriaceae bacterium]